MGTRISDGWQAGEGRLSSTEARGLAQRAFRQGDIPAVRRFARVFCTRAGIASGRLSDFVLAASEAAACATAWGPCTARIRLWLAGGRAFCEVSGDGMLVRQATQADCPDGHQDEAEVLRRLVLRQLSDYVSVAVSPGGVRVMLSMSVA